MRRRPLWFIVLATVFFGVAISLPAQIMVIYGHGFKELPAVLEKLTLFNWLVFFGALVSGVLAWQVSPYVRFAVPALIALVGVNNYFVGHYATDYSMWQASFGTLGFALLNLPLLNRDIQWLLLHPEKRWWIRAERTRMNVPITIDGTRLSSVRSETFDISETGAFVTNNKDVAVGDWITVRMKFGTFYQFRCQARVVRRAEAAGIYPGGMGVQFMNMSWNDRRELKRHIERQTRDLAH